MVYSHYQLSTTTPILAVRSELGSPPTFIPGIARLAKYLAYITSPDAPPLVAKAVLVHKAIGASSKYGWWNNSWRLLQDLHVTPENVGSATWRISEMIYWVATGGGGCSNSRILMLTLSSAHSGSSNNLSPLQPISTRDLAISALLPFDSDVLATGWILNWVAIQVSLDLIAGAAFALVQLWVMNITPSNAQHCWIYRSSVTSMFHPNRSSSL